jgi:hypothetical protein
MMRRWIVGFVVGSAAFVASWGIGCNGEDTDLADVVYQGGTTDEALDAMLAAKVEDKPAEAALFTWPSNNDVVPLDPPPTFCWSWDETAMNGAPVQHDLRTYDIRTWVGHDEPKGKLAEAGDVLLREVLAGIPSAHAHGTPLSGTGYFLVFSTTKDPKLIRVFTTAHDYTPDAAAMAKLKGAGEAIHAVVTTAEFDQNRIAQDGGPYKGVEVTFTMAPM